MLTAYVQIFALFGLMPLSESVLYCLNHSKHVCYPCLTSNYNQNYCNKISNETKIISFEANTIINYGSYLNSTVRIIQEPNQLTLYYCGSNVTYIHIPKKFENPFQKLFSTRKYKQTFITLQQCLNFYCSRKLPQLVCFNRFMDTLDFSLGQQVTLTCVNNIVSANIFSLKLKILDDYQFFIYAQSLIYLKLDFPKLKHINCFSLENLVNLRLLDFSHNLIPLESYKCIFLFNPTIVRIGVDGQDIWSWCKDNLSIPNIDTIENHTEKSTSLKCKITVTEKMSEGDGERSLEDSLEESLENNQDFDLDYSEYAEDQTTTITNENLGNDPDTLYHNGKKYFVLIIFIVISVIAIINIIYKIFPKTLKNDHEHIHMDTLPRTRPEAV